MRYCGYARRRVHNVVVVFPVLVMGMRGVSGVRLENIAHYFQMLRANGDITSNVTFRNRMFCSAVAGTFEMRQKQLEQKTH